VTRVALSETGIAVKEKAYGSSCGLACNGSFMPMTMRLLSAPVLSVRPRLAFRTVKP